MKIALLSDLHLEFGEYQEPLPRADILLLAGDICSAHPEAQKNNKKFINEVREGNKYKEVIQIDGNHTGYSGNISDFNNNQICYVKDDVLIIACTLWSAEGSQLAYRMLNDRHISGFSWEWMNEQHNKDVRFITDCLEKHKDKKCIVCTHHLPSFQCINDKYKSMGKTGINQGFYSDLDNIINEYNPYAWCFGHTHSSVNKLHSNNRTRLLCNPLGYKLRTGYENKQFNPNFVFEV